MRVQSLTTDQAEGSFQGSFEVSFKGSLESHGERGGAGEGQRGPARASELRASELCVGDRVHHPSLGDRVRHPSLGDRVRPTAWRDGLAIAPLCGSGNRLDLKLPTLPTLRL